MATATRRRKSGLEDISETSAELWAGIESESSRRLLLAALAAFAKHGFQAATTRVIANGAGMSPAAVYVHYKSKSDLLYEISRIGHQSVLEEVEEALREPSDNPEYRVRRYVSAFAKWHADHHVVARVIQYELKALPPRQFRKIAELRARFGELLSAELQAGVETGAFDVPEIEATTLAILSLCIDLARWYHPSNDHKTSEQVGDFYADLVARMILAPRR
ncbi:MAG TPA: TetR/AcrR family transcriptional regulator [Thermoleophilaceae bacterium]|jgi:AcrR family transcriptional regulator